MNKADLRSVKPSLPREEFDRARFRPVPQHIVAYLLAVGSVTAQDRCWEENRKRCQAFDVLPYQRSVRAAARDPHRCRR